MLKDYAIDAIALDHLRKTCPRCEILDRKIYSDPDGIYFIANCRGPGQHFGDHSFFITRSTGEIWEIRSYQILSNGLDYWLQWYAEGWRPGTYRLKIMEVTSVTVLAKLLEEHGVSYQFRELANGIVWTKWERANEEEIRIRIATLPCTFLVRADFLREVLPMLAKQKLARVEYVYIGQSPEYDWRPENNSTAQLGPQWD